MAANNTFTFKLRNGYTKEYDYNAYVCWQKDDGNPNKRQILKRTNPALMAVLAAGTHEVEDDHGTPRVRQKVFPHFYWGVQQYAKNEYCVLLTPDGYVLRKRDHRVVEHTLANCPGSSIEEKNVNGYYGVPVLIVP